MLQTPTITDESVFTVSQLNHAARLLLENNFPLILVEGEISNFTVPSSGHWYFTLKDENAQIRSAMFKPRNGRVNFNPQNGDHVLARGRLSLYEGRGDFQLIVDQLEAVGDGKLQRQFEQLKNRLEKEGLFDAQRKKPLPDFVQTLGIITSPTGAAIHDVLTVLKRRYKPMNIIIYPTLVQGELAAAQIVKAIELANARQECDAILLTRGGGSLEDLWPFNEEKVARAIAASHLPIVTGIGHEIDFTIADFVSDQRAPTPSAAAELLSPNSIELLAALEHYQLRLERYLQHTLKNSLQLLAWLEKRLQQCHPKQQLLQLKQSVDYCEQRLRQAIQMILQTEQHRLQQLTGMLTVLSPLNTLSRGFAVVYKNEKVVTSPLALQQGDVITTRFATGHIVSTVNSTCDDHCKAE